MAQRSQRLVSSATRWAVWSRVTLSACCMQRATSTASSPSTSPPLRHRISVCDLPYLARTTISGMSLVPVL
ncbi:hypothetical protein E4T45_14988 [Aureobasidium sp. EXF-8846]|nr:hypothetical protein E4T45_14988 [Aureobasidium sp. EXF-8846]